MDILIFAILIALLIVVLWFYDKWREFKDKPSSDTKRTNMVKKDKERRESAKAYLWYSIRNETGNHIYTKYSYLTTDEIRKEFEPKGYTVTEDEIKW